MFKVCPNKTSIRAIFGQTCHKNQTSTTKKLLQVSVSSITVCDTTACRFVRHRGPCGSLLRLRDKSVRLVKAVKSTQKKIKTGASHLKPRAMFLCTYFWMWCVFFAWFCLSKVAMFVYLDVMFVPFFCVIFGYFDFMDFFRMILSSQILGSLSQ